MGAGERTVLVGAEQSLVPARHGQQRLLHGRDAPH